MLTFFLHLLIKVIDVYGVVWPNIQHGDELLYLKDTNKCHKFVEIAPTNLKWLRKYVYVINMLKRISKSCAVG